MSAADPFDLERFVDAQAGVLETALAELRAGKKRSHWMWFVFPQLKTLGRSGTARFYGLEGRAEALAYWRHPALGPRLLECTRLVLATRGRSAHDIFGSPDAPFTIVEYGDFQCGFCLKASGSIHEVYEELGDRLRRSE